MRTHPIAPIYNSSRATKAVTSPSNAGFVRGDLDKLETTEDKSDKSIVLNPYV